MSLGVGLVDGVLEEGFYVGQGPVAGAIGGDAHNGGLYEVVEAAEQEPQHAAGTDNPDGRIGELTLEDGKCVLQAPWLPLADLLVLTFHTNFQVLQNKIQCDTPHKGHP